MDVPYDPRIARFEILDGVADATRDALAACRTRTFEPQQVVYATGDEVTHVLLLSEGRIKVSRILASGRSVTICNLGEGDVLGLPSCTLGTPMAVTATAVTRVTAAAWPVRAVKRLLREDSAFAVNSLAMLGTYIQHLGANAEGHVGDVGGRIARAILNLSAERARWSSRDGGVLHVTRQEIADLVGSTLSTVSRTLSSWERQGIVSNGRGYVGIVDEAAVAKLADPHDDRAARGGLRSPSIRSVHRSGIGADLDAPRHA